MSIDNLAMIQHMAIWDDEALLKRGSNRQADNDNQDDDLTTNKSGEQDVWNCGICSCTYVEHGSVLVRLPCSGGHVFHGSCILKSVVMGNYSCPYCRADLSEVLGGDSNDDDRSENESADEDGSEDGSEDEDHDQYQDDN